MKRLLILGAGGHGRVIAELAGMLGEWRQIAFLDDRYASLNGRVSCPVIGAIADAGRFAGEYTHAAVAVGDGAMRMQWLERLSAYGYQLPVLKHPAAWVSPSAVVGEASVIMAGAVVQTDCRLGRGCIVNTCASVDHDCRLGDGVHICPGAHLGGDVHVGAGSWLGIGCSVIQGIRIGESVTVGAGAAVVADIADARTVVGVPAGNKTQRNRSE